MSERYYADIKKIAELKTEVDANSYLLTGDWELLSIKDRDAIKKIGDEEHFGLVRELIYVMGFKPKAVPTSVKPSEENHPSSTVDLPANIELLPWVPWVRGDHASGGWIFSDKKRYVADPEKGYKALTEEQSITLESLRIQIEESSVGEFTIGKFTYKLTGENNMFISRRPFKK